MAHLIDKIENHGTVLAKITFNGKRIAHEVSKYQTIDIFDTEIFGRILSIDNDIQLTEKDEMIYHKKMTEEVKSGDRVLVIGGGDGGIARECLRKFCTVDVVEIDQTVVDLCKEHLPQTASSFDDQRVRLIIQDGFVYLSTTKNKYDIVIADYNEYATFDNAMFHDMAFNVLREQDSGIIVSHIGQGTEYIDPQRIKDTRAVLKFKFRKASIQGFQVPSWYPGKFWKTVVTNLD